MARTKQQQIRFLVEMELLLPSPDSSPPHLAEKLSTSDKDEVERAVRAALKDKDSEERVVRIVRNVLVQLYKTFYNRRSFWSAGLNASPD